MVVETNIRKELMIDFHHLLNVLINTSTTDQVCKETTCPENVVVVIIIQLGISPPGVPGVVETGEWMIEEEQLMMSIQFLITLKTVVIEVIIKLLIIFCAFVCLFFFLFLNDVFKSVALSIQKIII